MERKEKTRQEKKRKVKAEKQRKEGAPGACG